MKRQTKQELRGKSFKELGDLVRDMRQDLLDGRTKKATEGESFGVRARVLRRDIARCLTIITEKQKTEVQG